jgi:hypothetical protein
MCNDDDDDDIGVDERSKLIFFFFPEIEYGDAKFVLVWLVLLV